MKSQPVIEATIDVFNCAKRFQINSLNSSKFPKLSSSATKVIIMAKVGTVSVVY